jgi:hypothetical protein
MIQNHLEISATDFDRNVIENHLFLLQELILGQGEKIIQQEQTVEELSRLMIRIAETLEQPKAKIENIHQDLNVLGKATIATYQKLENVSNGKELLALKAEQQALRKIADTVQRTLKIQSDNLVTHLDWKRTAAIVVSTAVLSSLCSVAIVQLIPNGWFHSATPIKPIAKKPVKSRN